MMNDHTGIGGYSARVEITLFADGREYRAAQVGPEFIMFDEPVLLAPGPATITVTVDGRPNAREVVIRGPQTPTTRVEFSRAA